MKNNEWFFPFTLVQHLSWSPVVAVAVVAVGN